jgi:hypothetical protein
MLQSFLFSFFLAWIAWIGDMLSISKGKKLPTLYRRVRDAGLQGLAMEQRDETI